MTEDVIGKGNEVKFISYNGEWPNLCSGTLVLEINNERYEFKGCLRSGGGINCNSWDVTKGEWEFNSNKNFSESLKREITYQINKNIPLGCCGGCL